MKLETEQLVILGLVAISIAALCFPETRGAVVLPVCTGLLGYLRGNHGKRDEG
jgi:hypothetical protein